MSFYDSTVRHSIYIERYKKRVVRDILERIEELTGDIFNAVAASDLESMSRRDLDRLLSGINRMIAQGYEPIAGQIEAALRELVGYEANWQATNMLRSGIIADIGIPSDADLWAAANSRPFQGRLLSEWIKGLAPNTASRVRQIIRQGYVDGSGSVEIARQIRGTRGRKGIMDISRRGAEAMVRTAIAHTASRARDKTYEQATGILGVQWVSVLDHRTSDICRNNDGRVGPVKPDRTWKPPSGFKVLQPRSARPPAHVGCRSTMVPVTPRNVAALRVRPTYQDWLFKQPVAVQDDVLGVKRGQLFRKGGYTVDRFSDPTGQEYTLDQLRAKDAETFNEVFGE